MLAAGDAPLSASTAPAVWRAPSSQTQLHTLSALTQTSQQSPNAASYTDTHLGGASASLPMAPPGGIQRGGDGGRSAGPRARLPSEGCTWLQPSACPALPIPFPAHPIPFPSLPCPRRPRAHPPKPSTPRPRSLTPPPAPPDVSGAPPAFTPPGLSGRSRDHPPHVPQSPRALPRGSPRSPGSSSRARILRIFSGRPLSVASTRRCRRKLQPA